MKISKQSLAILIFLLITLVIFFIFGSSKEKISVCHDCNVILVTIDTLRADHLGTYGYFRDTSPSLTKLSKQGILFENAYSHSFVTTPSIASIITSVLPQYHGIKIIPSSRNTSELKENIPTIASMLKLKNYQTTAFTGGGSIAGAIGFNRGFDYYSDDDQILKYNSSSVYDNKILRWLKENKTNKFFLFIHTYAVHDPYLMPDNFSSMYDSNYSGKIVGSSEIFSKKYSYLLMWKKELWPKENEYFWSNVNGSDTRDIEHLKALYDSEIKYLDIFIGNLLETIKNSGIENKTIIVFTADHGEEFKEHGGFSHTNFYDENLHIPLIVYSPSLQEKELRIRTMVRSIDIFPTILDLLGLEIPQNLQGKSLLPLIGGREMSNILIAQEGNSFATRTKNWKYIDDRNELYDLVNDPKEQKNVIESHPDIANILKDYAVSIISQAPNEPQKNVQVNEEVIKKLKELGYVN